MILIHYNITLHVMGYGFVNWVNSFLKRNATPVLRYIYVRINSTVLCFIWVEIGGPHTRFAQRNMSEI